MTAFFSESLFWRPIYSIDFDLMGRRYANCIFEMQIHRQKRRTSFCFLTTWQLLMRKIHPHTRERERRVRNKNEQCKLAIKYGCALLKSHESRRYHQRYIYDSYWIPCSFALFNRFIKKCISNEFQHFISTIRTHSLTLSFSFGCEHCLWPWPCFPSIYAFSALDKWKLRKFNPYFAMRPIELINGNLNL